MRFKSTELMASELDFCINDNSLNRYRFRILTEGIATDNFLKNPVCLLEHNGDILSVGKWKNLRKEADGRFLGTLEFDESDPVAMKAYKKYKNGYMSAVSQSIEEVEVSNDPSVMLPGQEFETITKSELLEISLCNIPGHQNALKLFRRGQQVSMSVFTENTKNRSMANNEKTVEQLTAENVALKSRMAKSMVKMHLDRGAITEAEREFFERNAELDYAGTEKVLTSRKGNEVQDESKKVLATSLAELHFTRGAISADEKDFFVKAATADYEGTKKVLEMRKGTQAIDQHVAGMQPGSDTSKPGDGKTTEPTYMDMYKNDLPGLQKMRKENPDKYKTLLEAHVRTIGKSGKYILEAEDES